MNDTIHPKIKLTVRWLDIVFSQRFFSTIFSTILLKVLLNFLNIFTCPSYPAFSLSLIIVKILAIEMADSRAICVSLGYVSHSSMTFLTSLSLLPSVAFVMFSPPCFLDYVVIIIFIVGFVNYFFIFLLTMWDFEYIISITEKR